MIHLSRKMIFSKNKKAGKSRLCLTALESNLLRTIRSRSVAALMSEFRCGPAVLRTDEPESYSTLLNLNELAFAANFADRLGDFAFKNLATFVEVPRKSFFFENFVPTGRLEHKWPLSR